MKNIFKSKNIYILILLVLTVVAFPLAFSKKGIVYLNKVTKSSENKNGYNAYSYYDDDYESYYDNEYSEEYYYNDNNYNNQYNDNSYQYGFNPGYNNSISYSSNTNTGSYYATLPPSIKNTTSHIVYVGNTYNLMSDISSYHSYYGDVTNNIEIVYNNIIGDEVSNNYIRLTTPGEYNIIYKACSYPGSPYCRTASRKVIVKDQNQYTDTRYNKEPVWKNKGDYNCSSFDYNCDTYSISAPTATDPYSNKKLSVRLISGEVNQYKSGTYTLVYEAYTEHNVRGVAYKNVIVNYLGNDNNNSSVLPSSKYITSYYSKYYDDGLYSGTLKSDNDNNYSTQKQSKFINNYEWTNKVTYTYECTIEGGEGTDGWAYISTDTSDDHPTMEYSQNGYEGTLSKKEFYCKNGCSEKLIPELGTCTNLGERKQIYKTFVGIYYGNVYQNYNNNYGQETYSGYVYLKR